MWKDSVARLTFFTLVSIFVNQKDGISDTQNASNENLQQNDVQWNLNVLNANKEESKEECSKHTHLFINAT